MDNTVNQNRKSAKAAKNKERKARARKKRADAIAHQEEITQYVQNLILDGTTLDELDALNDECQDAAESILFDAGVRLSESQSDSTRWKSDLDVAALKLLKIDLKDHSTWIREVYTEELPRTDLLRKILTPTNLESHIITSSTSDGDEISTAVNIDKDGFIEIELPAAIRYLEDAITDDIIAPIILRSFDPSREYKVKKDLNIPYKVLRAWTIVDGRIIPASEAESFSAMNTHHVTGEPIPPEIAVEYADAWEIKRLQKINDY